MDDCPGHFGHIELARAVYHCGFVDEVLKILRCVCFHCSRLLLDENDPKHKNALKIKDPATRLRAIHDLCKSKQGKTCATKAIDGKKPEDAPLENAEGEEAMLEEDFQHLGLTEKAKDSVKVPTGCGCLLPIYSRKEMSIQMEFADDKNEGMGITGDKRSKLSAQRAFDILKEVSDDDVLKLGLNPKYARPEWFLVKVMPVPPPHVRPEVAMEGAPAAADDLTFALTNIIKANINLEESIKKGEPPSEQESKVELLQTHVTSVFDNARQDTAQITQRSGRAIKSIRQRLSGKEGRLRGNLMGKRVDFSARTVITADPNLSIDQVGVPRAVASRLSVPVPVTNYNIHEMRALVEKTISKGKVEEIEWPGALYIIRPDKSRTDLRFVQNPSDAAIEVGWVVERHLQDDDVVLFNRQPSLHKMSIMGHRAKILDWSTFRLNLSVTTPYNADFDGDEMNLHVPQSITAKADANELMMVPRNIVTPATNRNVMGIVQDALLGVSRMTKRSVFIEKDVAMNVMMWIATWDGNLPAPAILKPKPLWTGKQLFSLICPKVNYRGSSIGHPKDYNDQKDPFNYTDTQVLIHSGELLQGIVDKNIVGTSGGSIVHVCWLEKGWEETRSFMNQVQTVVNYWMVNTSYSVSVSDTVADLKTMDFIQKTLDEAELQVSNVVQKAQEGELTLIPGKPLLESFEANVNEVLNSVRDTAGKKAIETLKDRNGIKGTVMAGSKGSNLNISQIIACVGQQNVQGKRIQYGFQQRTLPHFCKDDLGKASRGFVENSYLRGLTPQEFFFHAMGGREGLIDTAVKTSEVGYIQRRLVKAMETVMARYDTTLRNAQGGVIQFLFGEDGMDAQRIEQQVIDIATLNKRQFRDRFFIDLTADDFGYLNFKITATNEQALYIPRNLIELYRNDMELREMLEAEYRQLEEDRGELPRIMACRGSGFESDVKFYLPVNIDRLIWNAQRQFHIDLHKPTTLHPRVVYETVRQMCDGSGDKKYHIVTGDDHLSVVMGDDSLSIEAQRNATLLFQIMLRSKLSVKRVLKELRLNQESLKWLVGSILSDFHAARVHPGEMCGVMAAQSVGEPATQMTLNTFHNSGISSKNVTLGVPRLNEILNAAKNIKTPSLTIQPAPRIAQDENKSSDLIFQIEYATLMDITRKTEIHYDPDITTTIVEDDAAFVKEFFEVGDHKLRFDNWLPRDSIVASIVLCV